MRDMARYRALTAGLAGLTSGCLLVAGCGSSTTMADPPGPSPAPKAVATASPSKLPSSHAADVGSPTGSASTCVIPTRFAGKELSRLPVTDKVIALTFDGGANADGVASIRSTLIKRKVKATFFLTGNFVKHYPVRSARIAARDLVGNHTLTHPDLTKLSDEQISREVLGAEDLIRSTTGQDPRRFFRFPFGARTTHETGLLNSLCYVPFRWSVDSLGWRGTSGGQTTATVVARVVAAAKPGAIVLMHLGSNPDDHTTLDAAALPTIITRLRALGYRFVSLARVMSAAP